MKTRRGVNASRAHEKGFALLLAVWMLALLAALAAIVLADTGSGAAVVTSRLARAHAEALAEGGIHLAIFELTRPATVRRWPTDARPRSLHLGGGTVALTVVDEGGKVDLNDAPLDLIAGLAAGLGFAPADRAALTAGVAARRHWFAAQHDGVSGANGVSRLFDAAARPFADASELRALPGMTEAGFERLLPYVTVWSSAATVNPATALRPVLLAVPGVSPQAVDFYLDARTRDPAAPPPDGGKFLMPAPVRVVTVTARASLDDAAVTCQAIVLLSPNLTLRPYRVLRWRRL